MQQSKVSRIMTHLVAEYAVHAAAIAGRMPREAIDIGYGAPVLPRRRLSPEAAGLTQERAQRRVARVGPADADAVAALMPGCRGKHRRQRRPQTAQAADAANAAAREALRGSERVQLCTAGCSLGTTGCRRRTESCKATPQQLTVAALPCVHTKR